MDCGFLARWRLFSRKGVQCPVLKALHGLQSVGQVGARLDRQMVACDLTPWQGKTLIRTFFLLDLLPGHVDGLFADGFAFWCGDSPLGSPCLGLGFKRLLLLLLLHLLSLENGGLLGRCGNLGQRLDLLR